MAEQMITKYFSGLKNPPNEKPRPSIIPFPERKQDVGMVLTDKEQTLSILQLYNYIEPAKEVQTWSDVREGIVEQLFNTIINQRLSELSQQPDAPFLFGNTAFGNFIRGYRSFISFAALGDKPVKNAIDALISTTETVKKYGFLTSELDRAKSSLLTQTEKSFADKDKTEAKTAPQILSENNSMPLALPFSSTTPRLSL